ncbi:hypothetical protein NQ318_003957 [Aromia moschata]|uniref:Uncharacterized protein n=1 Tax=Aromia moschata TaxID=1265417 RepID=A0AAV8Z8E5_9CUCU|nr:hypothetical protein NQ318_003957 [Aromia moschata]
MKPDSRIEICSPSPTRNFMDTILKVLNFKNMSLSNFSVTNSISYEALKSDVPGVVFSAETDYNYTNKRFVRDGRPTRRPLTLRALVSLVLSTPKTGETNDTATDRIVSD